MFYLENIVQINRKKVNGMDKIIYIVNLLCIPLMLFSSNHQWDEKPYYKQLIILKYEGSYNGDFFFIIKYKENIKLLEDVCDHWYDIDSYKDLMCQYPIYYVYNCSYLFETLEEIDYFIKDKEKNIDSDFY